MTRDEILAIPAGGEMDKLVAEKVLQKPRCWQWVMQRVYPLEMQNFGCTHNGNCYPDGNPPFYSTNISAAWQVVDFFVNKYGGACIEQSDSQGWCASFYMVGIEFYATSDSAPLAICRAALLAVMEL